MAGAKRERVKKVNEDTFEMTVREPAERNLANKRIRELLAEHYELPLGQVRIVTGHHSQGKIFDIKL